MVANRCTACLVRSPYGIGWRTTTSRLPIALSARRNRASRLRFARSRSHRANRDDRSFRLEHRRLRTHEAKIRACRQRDRCLVHDRFVRDIAVSKDDLVDGKLSDQVSEFTFGKNRNAIGVEWARQRGRISASFDVWDLRRGKGDNLAGAGYRERQR